MKQKRKLTTSLMLLGITPLIEFGLLVLVITSGIIYAGLRDEVHYSLGVMADATRQAYDILYPGDYSEENGILEKGGADVREWLEMMDARKKITGADYTLFYGDTRYITTIKREDGRRVDGTKATQKVVDTVLLKNETYFSDKVMINKEPYFGFYAPITNSDGTVVCMFFTGRPRAEVMKSINHNILVVCFLEIATLLLVIAAIVLFSRRLIYALHKTESFLGKVAQGDLAAEIDPYVLTRTDEIGEMGRFAVMLQKSIIVLVGRDPLTGLGNRRSCDTVLGNLTKDAARDQDRFTIVMSDIDFFKRVNDAYGHQAGDETLKMIASLMKEHIEHLGFVFRWGGEEFLLIYEDMGEEEAREHLTKLQEEIRSAHVLWNDAVIQVTMTFGMAEYHGGESEESLIHLADERLYTGKNQGRDRIVGEKEA